MPKISPSRRFYKDLLSLPDSLQNKVWKIIDILSENPKHPSLRVKKMQGTGVVWEARVTRSYRLTFEMNEDVFILRRVGAHGILNKEG